MHIQIIAIVNAFLRQHSSLNKRNNLKVIGFFLIGTLWVIISHTYVTNLADSSVPSRRLQVSSSEYGGVSASPPLQHPTITSLIQLTKSRSSNNVQCPSNLVRVNDTLLKDSSMLFRGGRKIPRLVHISSGSRCNDKIIADNLDTWRLKDHYFFLHDDAAVQTLLDEDWPEFPLLKDVMKCMPKGMGAAWIDLWRLLVLWRYGGIYSDFDTSPVPEMFNETTITSEDDAFFVVDTIGGPSQWFMAASPRHPMIFLCIFRLIMNVLDQYDLGYFQVVFTTGPGAVAEGFASFMRNKKYRFRATAGRFVGVDNRTVTIVGNKTDENMYITRVIKALRNNGKKNEIYQKTNMTHLTKAGGTNYKPIQGVDESCLSRIYGLRGKELRSTVKSSYLTKSSS